MHLRVARIGTLEAEDHYVRVHTDAGSALILMRLGDALAELGGLEGVRTHRFWWVARGAARGVEGLNGRAELLIGDLRAPVSRAQLPLLDAQGWFEEPVSL